jgi:hypothetical protein
VINSTEAEVLGHEEDVGVLEREDWLDSMEFGEVSSIGLGTISNILISKTLWLGWGVTPDGQESDIFLDMVKFGVGRGLFLNEECGFGFAQRSDSESSRIATSESLDLCEEGRWGSSLSGGQKNLSVSMIS